MTYVVIILWILIMAWLWTRVRAVVVFEYERGLRYERGRFRGLLGPGSYWIFSPRTIIHKVDIRPTAVVIPGQEVVTSDGVGLKVSISAVYRVADPVQAVHSIDSYQTAAYSQIQLALREHVAARGVDDLLAGRSEVNQSLVATAAPVLERYGLELHSAEVKDLMFPGELKKVFSQVVRARQEGLAALEKARGESAALRSLANSAALLESRPALFQLRLLQAVEQHSGNTVVVNLGSAGDLPTKARADTGEAAAAEEDE